MLYLESLNIAMFDLMKDDSVVLIGEDLLDPYGGAFKVSKGLSTSFPKQVISTPISEQAITGAAVGMAMRGMKPIVEIMFGDFITLCVDQIVNHATKYNWMFNKQVDVPIVIRTPMGGGRGYGPTHSQSLESLFLSVPGLLIVAPSIFHNPGEMLKKCVTDINYPCLFIESKISYSKDIIQGRDLNGISIERVTNGSFENILLSLYPDEKSDVLIITYGSMAEISSECVYELFIDEEILVTVLVLGSVKPIDSKLVVNQSKKIGRVLVVEEGCVTGGWGSEVSSIIHESAFSSLMKPVERVGAKDLPIPASAIMEREVLPNLNSIKKKILELME